MISLICSMQKSTFIKIIITDTVFISYIVVITLLQILQLSYMIICQLGSFPIDSYTSVPQSIAEKLQLQKKKKKRPSPCRRRWQAVNPQIPNAKQALSSKTSRDRAKQSANPNRVITYLLLLLHLRLRLRLRLRLTPRRRSPSLTRRRLLVPLLVLLLLGWRAILCIRWRRSRRVVPVLHPKQKK